MPTQKFERAGSLALLTNTIDLSGLGAGSSRLCTPEYDNSNSSNLWFWGDFLINVQFGTAPTAGRTIELYIIPALDGTTYADGSATYLPPNLLVGAFVVVNTTNMQRIVLRGVPLPPAKFKALVRNNTNVAFTSTPEETQMLNMLPYRTQSG
jgi:hypothetical protein